MTAILSIAVDVIQISWINILLSIDNAIMIALACRALPDRQRHVGMALGAFGAVAMRVVFTLLVARLLDVPGLRLAGGLCVIYLASRLPFQGHETPGVDAKRTLSGAITAIVVTDVTLSLDNSLALAAAARGSAPLIVFGLTLSAPLILFGAQLLSSVIARLPLLVWFGAAILGWAGGQLIAGDPVWGLLQLTSPPEVLTAGSGSVLVLVAAALMMKRHARA